MMKDRLQKVLDCLFAELVLPLRGVADDIDESEKSLQSALTFSCNTSGIRSGVKFRPGFRDLRNRELRNRDLRNRDLRKLPP